MDPIIIAMPEEKEIEEPKEPESTPVEEAVAIVEVATELAEVIAEAAEGAEDEQVFAVHAKLDTLLSRVNDIDNKLTELLTVEVAEVVVENTPAEVEEIAAVADMIEEEVEEPEPEVEEVPVAITPQIKKKKSTKWV